MQLDQDNISKQKIQLLDCQCEIVLKCLEYYCYSANFLFERKGKYTSKEDEKKISLITDTYHQISNQIANTKSKSKIIKLQKNKKIS